MKKILIFGFFTFIPVIGYPEFSVWYEDGVKYISNVPKECIKTNNNNNKYLDTLCFYSKTTKQKKSNTTFENNISNKLNSTSQTSSTYSYTVSPSYDLRTEGEKYINEADVYCSDEIEKLSDYDSEWTNSFFEFKFYKYAWADQSKGIIAFLGDKIKFQNGFGAWQNYKYACYFDINSKKVISVEAEPGRL